MTVSRALWVLITIITVYFNYERGRAGAGAGAGAGGWCWLAAIKHFKITISSRGLVLGPVQGAGAAGVHQL